MALNFPGLDLKQVQKAITALKRYSGADAAADDALFEEDEFIYVMLSLKKSHPDKRSDKPIRIPVPHPIFEFEGADICLFVKDDKTGAGHKAAKKKVAQYSQKAGISRVIGTSKLRTKYESFEQKRHLCREYDLFLADDRILPSLPKLIGKQFFRKKKQPIPIKLSTKEWDVQFQRARKCTVMFLSGGSCLSIKVARSSFQAEAVLDNFVAVLSAAVGRVPKKWANIQAVFLKTADSVALPVYQSVPSQPVTIK